MLESLVILPDIPVGLVEKLLVRVEFVFQEGAAYGLLHLALALGRGLPAVEAHLLHDGVDICHNPFDDDVSILGLRLVEEFRERGKSLVLLFLRIVLLLRFDGVLGDLEDG